MLKLEQFHLYRLYLTMWGSFGKGGGGTFYHLFISKDSLLVLLFGSISGDYLLYWCTTWAGSRPFRTPRPIMRPLCYGTPFTLKIMLKCLEHSQRIVHF